MSEDKQILLGTIEGDEPILINISYFKGKKYLDIRKYYYDKGGQLKPTPKGINLNAGDLFLLKKIIEDKTPELTKEFGI